MFTVYQTHSQSNQLTKWDYLNDQIYIPYYFHVYFEIYFLQYKVWDRLCVESIPLFLVWSMEYARNIYWWGCALAHRKGGLRCGHSPKKGGKKKGSQELKLHKRGLLGAYLLSIFTFTCQHDQLVGVH